MKQFGVEIDPDYSPRYNISPSQQVGRIRRIGVLLETVGTHPVLAKDPKIGYKMINARSETIFQKPAFRDAFKKRRCLIPADGFYEWKKDGATKQPFNFGMADDSIFSFAGVWESWRSPEGAVVESCSILTTTPNELVADVHDRMPVILPEAHHKMWLATEPARAEQLIELLVPYAAEPMKKYAVSPIVNSPKNDRAECAAAVGA